MIFTVDENTDECFASITREGSAEKYICTFGTCENPVCSCGTLHITLEPLTGNNQDDNELVSHQIDVDTIERELCYPPDKDIPERQLAFANFFLSELDEDDFKFLSTTYLYRKNEITEKADPTSIEAVFDYDEVENDGLMYLYNQVLPYGNQILVTINSKDSVVLDQYCLLPDCSCTDTKLSIYAADENEISKGELCIISLNYKNKHWETFEGHSFPISAKDAKSAIESTYPDFYDMLRNRHLKLKSIYAHCRKNDYATQPPEQSQKVGRNDPCPCGSGKKYKKCCLK